MSEAIQRYHMWCSGTHKHGLNQDVNGELFAVSDVIAMVKEVRQSEVDGLNIRQYLEACDAIILRLEANP